MVVTLLLLVVAALVVAGGVVGDARGRDASPENLVRAYFSALERGDLEAALAAIQPSARASSVSFVANALDNEYRVEGVAVRSPSLLERLRGETPDPQEATAFIEVTEAVSGARWQAAPKVALVAEGGRVYLAKPPLA